LLSESLGKRVSIASNIRPASAREALSSSCLSDQAALKCAYQSFGSSSAACAYALLASAQDRARLNAYAALRQYVAESAARIAAVRYAAPASAYRLRSSSSHPSDAKRSGAESPAAARA